MNLQLTLLPARNERVPTFEQTLTALGDIPAILYRALEFGTAQNREFFEKMSKRERPRPHIREIIVRDQAKRFLERNDFQVDEETVTVGDEPLAALLLRCGPVQARVLKGIGGLVPGCGDSLRRRRFYRQHPGSYQDRKGQLRQTKLNLLILWDFDSVFNLDRLWLVCPMRGGETSADVLVHWHEPIPHPLTTTLPIIPDDIQKHEDELENLLRDQDESQADSPKEA